MNDDRFSDRIDALSASKRALLELDLEALDDQLGAEPIAIIGMGCRFPGGVASPADYWQLLRDGVDAVGTVPADRWDAGALEAANPGAAWAKPLVHGAFLDAVDGFDCEFFGIAPREAISMDPQQRLLLEVAWEALEDAGLPAADLAGSQTGVFVGISTNEYLSLIQRAAPEQRDLYLVVGNALNGAPGRLSYVLGLRGPSMAIDTACSSSLVATHLACQSLRNHESELALAGGVSVILTPDATVILSSSGTMAADGRCKTFDAAADGYVRGEGCGVLVLKRLDDAQRDGDRIWGVIRGSAVGQDGNSGGLTVPNGAAQQALIRRALEDADVDAADVGYVEAHGTGTPLGDPIEMRAIAAVYGDAARTTPLAVGSAKTNIGHTEAAAGLAGLMKAVLALRARQLPPHLHLQTLNPSIDLAAIPAVIPTTLTDHWRGSGPLLAGVSAFGFTGAIAHMIVEAAPEALAEAPAQRGAQAPHLLAISARSRPALAALAERYRRAIEAGGTEVASWCRSAAVGRSHHDHRLAVLAHTPAELVQGLETFARGEPSSTVWTGRRAAGDRSKLAFVFPGQGSQWLGMARQLHASEPTFAAALNACDEAMQPLMGRRLIEGLFADGEASPLDEIDFLQPALFAIQVAIAAQWRAWGVEPRAVVGHSMGEIAAAHVAGALSLEDACRVVCRRSALVVPLIGKGTMAAVELSHAEAEAKIAPYADRVSVAVSNGPRSTVLSGEPEAIEVILAALTDEEVFCRRVKVDFAAHGPQVEVLRDGLRAALAEVRPKAAKIPIYSTVTDSVITGAEMDAEYWTRNLREPVRFHAAISAMQAAGYDRFVEVSAHPVLTPAISGAMHAAGATATVVGSLRAEIDEREALLCSVGALYADGQVFDWRKLSCKAPAVELPGYPWQRRRCWVAAGPPALPVAMNTGRRHPHLGERITTTPELSRFEVTMTSGQPAYLDDHRINGVVVVPGSSHVSMLLSAAQVVFGDKPVVLHDIYFPQALAIADDESRVLALTLSSDDARRSSFRVTSGATTHATGGLAVDEVLPEPPAVDLAEIRARCGEALEGAAFYGEIRDVGYHLGATFRWIDAIWRAPGEALARMRSPRPADDAGNYVLTPGLVDSFFQILGAGFLTSRAVDEVTSGDVFIPSGVGRLVFNGGATDRLWCHAVVHDATATDEVSGDFRVYDEAGRLVVEATEMRLRRATADALRVGIGSGPSDWFHEICWRQQDQPVAEPAALGAWIVLADQGEVGRTLATRLSDEGRRCLVVGAGDDYETETSGAVTIDPSRPEHWDRLLASQDDLRGVVHLWSLDDADAAHEAAGCASATSLVQALLRRGSTRQPRLWLVTKNAQPVLGSDGRRMRCGGAMLWGLGKVIDQEHPELGATLIDLADDAEIDLVSMLSFTAEERLLALRGASAYVARLTATGPLEAPAPVLGPAGDRPFRLEIDRPGILDSLSLRTFAPTPTGPDDVTIEVAAAGLNFLDVMKAMGIYPGLDLQAHIPLGGEAAGRVIAVGEAVDHIAVGDEVVALAPSSFATTVTTPSYYVAPKPAHLSLEEAVSIPLVFMTAYHALHQLGRLAAGERVLIHSASGGTGLAAIQIARLAGAEVFATAGRPEKRAFLRNLGVAHVMDSRSLDWAAEIMDVTDGQGVDVVLNSLAGEAIPKGLEVLARYGRFLEIGKRDIYQNQRIGLLPFKKSLSYVAVDLAGMFGAKPRACGALLTEVMGLVEARRLGPIHREVFPIDCAADGFRRMAQAKHIGKVVVSVRGDEAPPLDRVEVAPMATSTFKAGGVYLITGGLGALGLEVARWLVDKGARHLALLGRRAPSAEALAKIEALTEAGASVTVLSADVARPDQLSEALDAIVLPLAGVIHAAGVLDDAMLASTTEARMRAVLAPKVSGAWNLHEATIDRELDLFVLFSAGASILGSPGQGSYAAGNAFMDALAHLRRARGLPALSINWGPWADVGLAAQVDGRGKRLAAKGLGSVDVGAGLQAMAQAIDAGRTQVAVLPLNIAALAANAPQLVASPFYAELTTAQRGGRTVDSALGRALAQAAGEDSRLTIVQAHLAEQIAAVLMVPTSRLSPQDGLRNLGFDSLTALELRNRLEASLAASLSPTLVWNHDTIGDLAAHLAAGLGAGAVNPVPPRPELVPDPAGRFEPFPLTGTQQAYWVGRGGDIELGNIGCHAYQEVDLDDLDLPRFNRAWQRLVERHDMLRMTVLPDGRQQILEHTPFYEIEVLDLRQGEAEAVQAALLQVRERMSHQLMDPGVWPLFEIRATRLPGDRVRLHVSVDTLIGDAWSFRVLGTELEAIYDDPDHRLPTLALTFRDYVLAEIAPEDTEPYRRSLLWWQDKLQTLPEAPQLPVARSASEIEQPRFSRRAGRLDAASWAAVRARAESAGLTPSDILLTAYAEVLGQWSGEPRFTINIPQFNRLPLHPEVAQIVGEFASFTLVDVDTETPASFEALAAAVHDRLWDNLAHREVSGVRLLRELARMKGEGPSVAMPVVFTSLLSLGAVAKNASLLGTRGDVAFSITQTPQVWLDLQVSESDGAMVFHWDSVDALFGDGLMDAMFEAFATRLRTLAGEPAAWSAPTGSLVPAEQRAMIAAVNNTDVDLGEGLVQAPFIAQALAHPERVAVVSGDRRLTYGEVLRRASQLGRLLADRGAEPGELVAVFMDKGWPQVVAVFAALQSGAAYLAIDPRLPDERARHLLEHGEVRWVLTTEATDARFEWPAGVEPILVDGGDGSALSPAVQQAPQSPDDLAYVLYTSGSTGLPKGVEIAHRGLLNAIVATNRAFDVGPDDRVLAVTALHHDMSGFDVFGVLGAGGTVVIPDADGARDPAHWAALMRREQVTLWNSVPPMMAMLLEYAGGATGVVPASLRLAFLGGDWIGVDQPAALAKISDGAQVVSVGGPTETTMWNIWHPVQPGDCDGPSIPYGKPIANTQYHVLDQQQRQRPVWVPGELCVTGVGVAKGYWRDEAKTREKFVQHPLTGARMCRTGDRGRWRPDGSIEFLGRIDAQVKILGHRVEPGEVEAALRTHEAVADAVVMPVGADTARRALAAYVLTDDHAPEANLDLVADRAERLAFKAERHGIRDDLAAPSLALPRDFDAVPHYTERRSYRTYGPGPLDVAQVAGLLGGLRALEIDGLPFPKYRYGSGGGLYPVQAYLHVKPGCVRGIEGGYYYHHPLEHALKRIEPYSPIDPGIHVATNRALFEAASFSVFLIADLGAIAPMYGDGPSEHFIRLEAGAMTHLLESTGPEYGIGLCQVGSAAFSKLAGRFHLGEQHVFIHGLLGGPLVRDDADPVAGVLRDWTAYDITSKRSAADPETLKAYLRDRLPPYMVPAYVVPMSAWPLSRTGKIDRRALPPPDTAEVTRSTEHVAPSTATEVMLAEIWCELLGIETVGAHESFIEIGGDSLLAMRMVSKVGEAIGAKVSIRLLFAHPTIAGFAAQLETLGDDRGSTPAVSPEAVGETSANLELVEDPLPLLIERGALPRPDAAAVFSLPDSVAEHLGWGRQAFIDRWCGGAPHAFGLLQTKLGAIAVIMLPRFTSDLYADREALSREVAQAATLAGSMGASVLSLTGIVSSATDYGRSVETAPGSPKISTGHATTGATVLLAIRWILSEARRRIEGERVAFVGLGSIGRTSLRLMLRCLPHPEAIVLCDVYSKTEDLERLRDEVRASGFGGAIEICGSSGALPDAVYAASLIVGATNVPDILDVDRLASGTLIVDDSAPHCFDAGAAIRRFERSGDILFTEGGLVRFAEPVKETRHVPEAVRAALEPQQLAIFGRHTAHEMTGCVYSSLLSATDQSLVPTTGLVSAQQCEQHYEALQRLGHDAAALHCEGFVSRYDLAPALIRSFAERFGRLP